MFLLTNLGIFTVMHLNSLPYLSSLDMTLFTCKEIIRNI